MKRNRVIDAVGRDELAEFLFRNRAGTTVPEGDGLAAATGGRINPNSPV
jgi:hypothetical protein